MNPARQPLHSCLYACSVMHHRFAPKVHHFQHDLFLFYLDLDELDTVAQRLFLFGHNRRNLYSFRDADHEPAGPNPLKERLAAFLRQQEIELDPFGRVMLLTLPRVGGYIFNPLSVYYCLDAAGVPVCAVAEVGNTFRELKLYLLRREQLDAGGTFRQRVPKHFYVSPFSSLALDFDFRLRLPGEDLDIRIDDFDGADKVLVSTLAGRRFELTNRNLIWFTLKYPFITLKVIFLIHWHAFRLWLKRVPFHRKSADTGLQRGVLRPHPNPVPRTK